MLGLYGSGVDCATFAWFTAKVTAKMPPRDPEAFGWGPVSRHVAANLALFRAERGMSTTRLSQGLAKLGSPIPPTGITRIEKGQRRVDADDLVALAAVLNVSPLALLLPAEGSSRTAVVDLTSEQSALLVDAWRWAEGVSALPFEPGDRAGQEQQEAYERLSQSPRLRYVRRQPAGQAVETLRDDVHRLLELAQISSDTTGVDDEFRRRLGLARETLARLTHELDRVEVDHAELERFHRERRAQRDNDSKR